MSTINIANQGYLNKIKKQLERREEKASIRQLSTSLPLPTTLPTTSSTTSPTTLPTNLPTGLSVASSAKAPLALSAESKPPTISKTNHTNEAKKPNQLIAANKQNVNKQANTQHEMERLKGLGLTVSVGQVLKSPATVAEKIKPQSKAELVSVQKPSNPGVSGKKSEEIGARQVPSSEKKPQSIAAAKQTAPSYSAAQKLQLKSQVGK